ncbi:hypothetical protein DYY65_09995 [Nitrososphaera sp. AFS]|nr:hypothetical protein [Nitrososphaera sp. AFS]
MAYTCSSSSSTHNVKLQSSLTGSSGGCAVSSSAATTSGPNSTASGPNNTIGIGLGSNSLSVSSVASNIPGHAFGNGQINENSGGVGTTSSASSGGSQASCSSSTATTSGGAVTSSSSQSQPGKCP